MSSNNKPRVKTDYLTARISAKSMEKLKRVAAQRGVTVTTLITDELVELFRQQGLSTL